MNTNKLARKALKALPFYLLVAAIMVFLLFPFYWGFVTSLKTENDVYNFSGNFLVPQFPTLSNYELLFTRKGYFNWFANTFSVSIISTFISTAISVMAGFAIARLRFRGAALAGTLIFVTYLAPRGFLFVPLAQLLRDIGLLGEMSALYLTYPTFLVPFATWLLSGYFTNVPHEPEECAQVDGASRIGAIVRITLPMAMPGILTAGIFAFTASWNELLYSIAFVNGDANKMLTSGVVGAFTMGDFLVYGPMMAAATMASLPIALLYILFTDRFVSGITAGATKG
ncbi:MAG: carbohydrate ABC transporter permease [Thermoflexales bacterium]|jgi:multiple sugar transport system permease protein|nr:carbohydrate ABC transporter permease [Thermoflexales bacterium]MBP8242666.1 carbohydrate ABC transporter permease [Thermoflexales bacterium]